MKVQAQAHIFGCPAAAGEKKINKHLSGLLLVIARLLWVAVAMLAIGSLIASLPQGYARLTKVCLEAACAPDQLTPAGIRALVGHGLSIGFYAAYNVLIVIVFAVVSCGLAAIIFWRRSDDLMALFVSVTLIISGVFLSEYIEVLRDLHPAGGLLVDVMAGLGWICFPTLFYIFPDGRFVPAWTRALPLAWVAIQMPYLFYTLVPTVPLILYLVVGNWPPLPQIALYLILFITCLYAQIYRYQCISNQAQRQQTKWVVFGMVTTLVVITGTLLPEIAFPALALAGTLSDFIITALQAISFLLIPITIGIAILRYNLWDIDLIINRALVYTVLTMILACFYAGSVIALQYLFRALTDQTSPLAIAASTLALAALFDPLRWRVQAGIDRHFYRRKYDAAQALAAFSTTLQDEVDLPRLIERLESVIWETIQPAYIVTWLRTGSGFCIAQLDTVELTRHRSQMSLAEIEIPAQDPLVKYIRSAAGVVELDRLGLTSPACQRLKSGEVKLVVPLICQGDLIGWLSLGARLSEQGYSADDRLLLTQLAGQVAPAVRVAQLARQQQAEAREHERLEQELRVARLIQQTLLPQAVPTLPGWHIAVYWQPARAVGGDFYDFLPLPDGRCVLVIADVADKGVPAALVMATTRAILRGTARRSLSPGTALARANDLLYPETPPQMFVTCLYAILEPASGRLQYANAGHNLPYRSCNGQVAELRATGMPLGLLPGMHYEEHETTIEPGECLLLYSDGLVEAHNPRREMFGFPRLQAFLRNPSDIRSRLLDDLLIELAEFTGQDWEQEDDVTLVTLERKASPTEEAACQTVAEFIFPSEAGCERQIAEQVVTTLAQFQLAPRRLERLKTAVAEAIINAVEHGNRYQLELGVAVQVLASRTALAVRITDQGGGQPISQPEAPNLDAKLAGLQTPRGWGLFLIEKMVDEVRYTSDESQHTIELILYLTDS